MILPEDRGGGDRDPAEDVPRFRRVGKVLLAAALLAARLKLSRKEPPQEPQSPKG